MKTVKLWRNGNFIIANCGSDKEKALRKEGWNDKKQAKETPKPEKAAETASQDTPNAAS